MSGGRYRRLEVDNIAKVLLVGYNNSDKRRDYKNGIC
jgi:hypothetical protein